MGDIKRFIQIADKYANGLDDKVDFKQFWSLINSLYNATNKQDKSKIQITKHCFYILIFQI
jgi:hypothetical protein